MLKYKQVKEQEKKPKDFLQILLKKLLMENLFIKLIQVVISLPLKTIKQCVKILKKYLSKLLWKEQFYYGIIMKLYHYKQMIK